MTEENGALQATVEDLASRSKCQNLRVIGLPEDIEGNNLRQFMADLFKEVAAEALSDSTPELDRAHRSLRPKPRQGSRPVIVRFHRYIDKEKVLLWAKDHCNMTYRGHNIKFYEDFSAAVAKRRAAFNQVKSLLFKKGIRFSMIYPARLCVTFNGVTHIFDSPEQVELFLPRTHTRLMKEGVSGAITDTCELTIFLRPLSLFFYLVAGLSQGKAQLHCWRGPQTMNSTTYYSIPPPVRWRRCLSILVSCNLFCFIPCVAFLFCLYIKCGIYSKKHILNLMTCEY